MLAGVLVGEDRRRDAPSYRRSSKLVDNVANSVNYIVKGFVLVLP
jgi:hypothetical protein